MNPDQLKQKRQVTLYKHNAGCVREIDIFYPNYLYGRPTVNRY